MRHRQRMRPVLHSPQTLTWPQMAAQTRDILLAFVDNRPLSHCFRAMNTVTIFGSSPGDQDITLALDSVALYSHQAHYSSPSLLGSLLVCLSSLSTHPSTFPSLPFLHHSLDHLSDTQGLWVSRFVSAVLWLTHATWHQGRGPLRLALPTWVSWDGQGSS